MKRQWDIEELIEHFTLLPADVAFLAQRSGATRLGCALLLKCFQYEGRFPHAKHEIPKAVVDYVAHQLKLEDSLFAQYDWDGRTIKSHRTQIRDYLEFREATTLDAEEMTNWLISTQLSSDQNLEHLKAIVIARFRELKIEPPTTERVERLIRSACMTYEHGLFAQIIQEIPSETRFHLDNLLERSTAAVVQQDRTQEADEKLHSRPDGRHDVVTWHDLKTSPGAVGLESVLQEIDKLRVLQQLALPPDLFRDVSPSVVTLYRERAAAETLYELRRHPDATRYTLLAAFCVQRKAEVIDSLVDLLLLVIHRIEAKAEKRVGKQYLEEVKKVEGKPRLLYQVAEAALDHPEQTIRTGIFPVLSEEKCKAIVKEYKAKGDYQEQVYQTMRSSYRDHYRRMVPLIVNMLEVHSNNVLHRPVIEALEILKRFAYVPGIYYPADERIPHSSPLHPHRTSATGYH